MTDPDYFLLTEFRALPEMDNETSYPDAKVLAAAAYFTSIVENELGTPVVLRTFTETLDGMWAGTLPLLHSGVTLTSVTVDGTAVTTSRLNVDATGRLRYKDGCTRWSGVGLGNVVVTYTAGMYSTCPADIKDAVMWATRDRLITQAQESGSWDRKTSETSDFGTVNYRLAGEKWPTGYPDLDAVIASRQRSLGPAAG